MAAEEQQQEGGQYQLREAHHYKIIASLMGAEYEVEAINT
jgi:hypothetical protein